MEQILEKNHTYLIKWKENLLKIRVITVTQTSYEIKFMDGSFYSSSQWYLKHDFKNKWEIIEDISELGIRTIKIVMPDIETPENSDLSNKEESNLDVKKIITNPSFFEKMSNFFKILILVFFLIPTSVFSQENTKDTIKISISQSEEYRKIALIKKYGTDIGLRIFNSQVWVDMTQTMLIESIGAPDDIISISGSPNDTIEIWSYYFLDKEIRIVNFKIRKICPLLLAI